jgi:Fe(3+) dicitrate transport protein
VNVQDEEGYGLRPHIGLRGAGAERSGNITLMEDGVLIAPAPYSAPAAYYFPAMGRMEGIEVRKGASQVRYGPRTLGGAVNLLSATIPERRSWRAEIGGGGDGTLRTHARAGDAGERHGWMLEGLQARTSGFKEIQGGGSSGFDVRDVLGRFRVNTRRDARRYQELELKVGWNGHTSDETYLGLTEADFRATPNLRYAASRNDVMETDHRQLQLRYFAQLTHRPTSS